jgi:PAS domain S-box-containing protein
VTARAPRGQAAESRFQTIFEQSPFSMQIFAPDGTATAVNRAWERLWGFTLEEIGGYNILQDRQLAEQGVMPHILRGFAGEVTEVPAIKYAPDRSDPRLNPVPYRWVRASIYPVLDDDGAVREVVLMHVDVTAHRETEEQLVRTEEQYRRIFEASSDGLIINDPTTGRVVEANPAVCRMHGYSYEEFIGLHGSAFIHPDYHPAFAEFVETIAAGGTYQCEALDTRKDGTCLYVEVHGSPIMYNDRLHILAVVRDVTERVEAENQYRAVFEATHDCLTIYDENGFVVEANPAVCEVTGYTHDEIIGLHYRDLALTEYHALIDQAFQAVLAGQSVSGRGVSLGKGGRPIPTEGDSTRITFRGKPHVLMAVRDITERVKAEEDLERRVADRTRELSALLEVSTNVVSTLALAPLLDVIFDQLKTVVDYSDASIFTVQGDELVILRNHGPLPAQVLQGFRTPIRPGTLAGMIVLDDQTVIIDDTHGVSLEATRFREAVGPLFGMSGGAVRSWVGVPMRVGDRVIGGLTFSHSEPGYYGPHYAALGRAVAQQVALAMENVRLYEEAQRSAVVEERQRLSRELHDSVSQALYSIGLGAKTARSVLEPGSKAEEPLDFVLGQAERGLAEMRALIFELRPQSLEQEGLVGGLQKLTAALRAREPIAVETRLDAEPQVPLPVKEAIYRIAQEALHNVVKHAHPANVEIRLTVSDELVLEIRDDGCGFDTGMAYPGHIGLHSMRERASQVGGTLEVGSAPGKGTSIRVRVPSICR